MPPILTVGVTTHNERSNIQTLLDQLLLLDGNAVHVIVFDDASTDGTAALISGHPLSKQPHFKAHLSETNFGSPSIGRKYIADHASTPHVTFVDGDDLIDPKALTIVVKRLSPGFDIVVTPFMNGPRREFPNVFDNNQPISNSTVARILSGIGGKIYNREALVLHTEDSIKGRSEDVRLNIRIILGGFDRIRLEDTKPFYFITASRKSTLAKNILLHEVAARIKNYEIIKERYGVNDIYIKGLHRNLLKVVREDITLREVERLERYKSIHDVMPFRIQNIVHLIDDISKSHPLAERVRHTITSADGRDIRHLCISALGDPSLLPETLSVEQDKEGVIAYLGACHATNTVVVSMNDVIRAFPPSVRAQISRLPILHIADSPLAQMIRTSDAMTDADHLNRYRVSRILCLSDKDRDSHQQLGIQDLGKIRLPVEPRSHNVYSSGKNRFVTYVGPVDLKARGTTHLVPLARLMKQKGLPPLRIFASNEPGSPEAASLHARIAEFELNDWIEIDYDITNKERIFSEASIILLPPKEAPTNVILEAFSFGVPVIAPSYIAGPAEIVQHGENGFLLESLSADSVVSVLEGLLPDQRTALSQACFAHHRDYSMERYLTSIEEEAIRTVHVFPGSNEISPYPAFRSIEILTTQSTWTFLKKRFDTRERLLTWRIFLIQRVLPWRVVKVLRWMKAKLN